MGHTHTHIQKMVFSGKVRWLTYVVYLYAGFQLRHWDVPHKLHPGGDVFFNGLTRRRYAPCNALIPLPRKFKKHPRQKANFSVFFFFKMPPCRTVKNQNHPRGEANFIKKTQSPPSRRAQNLQNWKTRTRISSLHRKLKIFQSPPLGWWIDQNPYPPKSHSRILFNIFRSNVQPSPPP